MTMGFGPICNQKVVFRLVFEDGVTCQLTVKVSANLLLVTQNKG